MCANCDCPNDVPLDGSDTHAPWDTASLQWEPRTPISPQGRKTMLPGSTPSLCPRPPSPPAWSACHHVTKQMRPKRNCRELAAIPMPQPHKLRPRLTKYTLPLHILIHLIDKHTIGVTQKITTASINQTAHMCGRMGPPYGSSSTKNSMDSYMY